MLCTQEIQDGSYDDDQRIEYNYELDICKMQQCFLLCLISPQLFACKACCEIQ